MSIFIKKYIPQKLDELNYNKYLIPYLKRIINDPEMSHIIFHGPSNSGKKTIVNAFLREKYTIDNLKKYNENIKVSNSNIIEVSYYSSQSHFIINPSEYNIYDKIVIQTLIKNIAKTKKVNLECFKIILILNSHKLTYEAQSSLRRTFEIYSNNCRFILISNNISKIIKPLSSRTMKVRCGIPKKSDLKLFINKVLLDNNYILNDIEINNIIEKSNKNIETTIVILELLIKFNKNISEIVLPIKYEIKICNYIINSKNIIEFLNYKNLLYKKIINNIDSSQIIINITNELIKYLNEVQKKQCIELSAKYEHMMINGSKNFFYLETLIFKLYKLFNLYNN